VPEPARDELDATVDYRALRDCVREVNDANAYVLIESLAAAVADELASRFGLPVTVRVRKPGIAWAEWTAATASRPAS
jgi:dihydroneopterin aldolase